MLQTMFYLGSQSNVMILAICGAHSELPVLLFIVCLVMISAVSSALRVFLSMSLCSMCAASQFGRWPVLSVCCTIALEVVMFFMSVLCSLSLLLSPRPVSPTYVWSQPPHGML